MKGSRGTGAVGGRLGTSQELGDASGPDACAKTEGFYGVRGFRG